MTYQHNTAPFMTSHQSEQATHHMESEASILEMKPIDLPHDLSVDASGMNPRMDDPMLVPMAQPHAEVQRLPLDVITRDTSLQARVQLDQATIDSYAEDMKQGANFPPITVIKVEDLDQTHYLLVDGWHRFEATLQNGESHLQVNIIQGTRQDALKYAASANLKHGLRRTNADKRQAVKILLRDEILGKYSDRELSKLAGVDHKTVGRIRAELVVSGELPQIELQDVERQGKRYTQRAKRKEAVLQQEQHGNVELQIHQSQAEEEEDSQDQDSHLPLAAPPASHPQPEPDREPDIDVAQRDDEGPSAENQEVASQSEGTDANPEKSDGGDPHDPQDRPSADLPEPQVSQAALRVLQSLFDRCEGDVRTFRAQHLCDGLDDAKVKQSLDCFDRGLQDARHILATDSQPTEPVGADLDVVENARPADDEQREPEDLDAQGARFSSQAASTTTAPVTPAAVVQAFVQSRCIPACNPVAQHEVWASIDTWIADQGLPQPEKDEIIRTLRQMGFVDSLDMVRNGAKTDANWQWQGFELLPSDAADNEGDPFGSPQP